MIVITHVTFIIIFCQLQYTQINFSACEEFVTRSSEQQINEIFFQILLIRHYQYVYLIWHTRVSIYFFCRHPKFVRFTYENFVWCLKRFFVTNIGKFLAVLNKDFSVVALLYYSQFLDMLPLDLQNTYRNWQYLDSFIRCFIFSISWSSIFTKSQWWKYRRCFHARLSFNKLWFMKIPKINFRS